MPRTFRLPPNLDALDLEPEPDEAEVRSIQREYTGRDSLPGFPEYFAKDIMGGGLQALKSAAFWVPEPVRRGARAVSDYITAPDLRGEEPAFSLPQSMQALSPYVPNRAQVKGFTGGAVEGLGEQVNPANVLTLGRAPLVAKIPGMVKPLVTGAVDLAGLTAGTEQTGEGIGEGDWLKAALGLTTLGLSGHQLAKNPVMGTRSATVPEAAPARPPAPDAYDPNFNARYKTPPPAPDLTAGLPPTMPPPVPGEVPASMPAPFTEPAVPPAMAAPRPGRPVVGPTRRAYDVDEALGGLLGQPENVAPAPATALPAGTQQRLRDLGMDEDMIRGLSMDEANEVISNVDRMDTELGFEPGQVSNEPIQPQTGVFTPEAQRQLMRELAADPTNVKGAREQMARLSDINAAREAAPPRDVTADDPLFGEYLQRAQERNPNADPGQVRQEFDLARELFDDQQRSLDEGGGDLRSLIERIVKKGGIASMDEAKWVEANRKNFRKQPVASGELARVKQAGGGFGKFAGFSGVFRARGGNPTDRLATDLIREFPEYADKFQTGDALLQFLDDLNTQGTYREGATSVRRGPPRLDDLVLPESLRFSERGSAPTEEPNPLDSIMELFKDEPTAAPQEAQLPVVEAKRIADEVLARPEEPTTEFQQAQQSRRVVDRLLGMQDDVRQGDIERNLRQEGYEADQRTLNEPVEPTPIERRSVMRDVNAEPIDVMDAIERGDWQAVDRAAAEAQAAQAPEGLDVMRSLEQPNAPRLAGLQDGGNGILQVQFDAANPVTVEQVRSMFPGRNMEVQKFAPNVIRPDIQRFRIDVFDENGRMSKRVASEMAAEAGSGFRDWGKTPQGQFLGERPIQPQPGDIVNIPDVVAAMSKKPSDVEIPGMEDVRATENATPEVADVPFALEPPKRGQAIEQQARGAKEADAQTSLDDLLGSEKGEFRVPALAPVLGGVAGGTAGYASADDDAPTGEKLVRAGVGAMAGLAAGIGATALGRSKSGTGPSGTRAVEGASPTAATPPARRQNTPREEGVAEQPRSPVDNQTATEAASTIQPPRGRAIRLPKYAGNINLERLDTPDAVKATVTQIARDIRPQLETARRGQIAQDVTKQMAAELGMTVQQLLERRPGQAFNAEQALAARELNVASATQLTGAAQAVREAPTPENYARFMQSLQQQVAVQQQIAGFTAEAGRTLSQFRMMAEARGSLPDLNDLILTSGGIDNIDAIAQRLLEIDPTNLRAVNQFAREATRPTMLDKAYELWMNALLSGPVTHMANTVSNGLTTGTHPLEKSAAGLLDLIRAKSGGTPQERFVREGAYSMLGLWKGVGGGLRAGLTAALTDTASFGNEKLEAQAPGKIGGTVGHIVRIPTKALQFSDEFFKNIVYSADMHARAIRQTMREGVKGKEIGERVAEILANPSKELKQAAAQEALYRTFNNPLGDIGQWAMRGRKLIPGARWIVPFMRTPINVAKFGVQRTPLYLGKVLTQIAKGELSAGDLSDESAKMAVGALIGFGVASAYKNGMITGGGSPKPDEHATKAVTRPDYSIKVGDQWYSYQRLEPLGISLGLTADFMEALDIDPKKNDIIDVPNKVLYSFSRNLQSKTFLQGVTDFFNVLSDYPRYGDRFIQRLTGSAVPNTIAQFARASDPVVRKPRSVTENIKNRLGGGSDLTPMIDVFGQPITSDMGPLERLVSPVQRRNVKNDPVVDELNTLGVSLSVPSETLTLPKGEQLTSADKSTLAQAKGRSVHDALDELLNSAGYQRADEDGRRDRIEKAVNVARDTISRRARTRARRGESLTLESLLGMER